MNIKTLRMSSNLTQKELAEMLGVKRTTVSMWESDAVKPTADKLPLLAKTLGCTIDELYEGE